MKIKPEHYHHVKTTIDNIISVNPVTRNYVKVAVWSTTAETDLSRLLFAIKGMSTWICDNIYPYANDTHIKTMLKAMAAEYRRYEW